MQGPYGLFLVKQLFQKVLSGSDSVAILDVCFDVANKRVKTIPDLKDPTTRDCLQSIFPLMICPALWRMNGWNLRYLASLYVLSNDPAVQQSFRDAVKAFPQHIPFLFEEEKRDAALVEALSETMAEYFAYASTDNYRLEEHNGGVLIDWTPPQDLVERREPEAAPARERLKIMALQMWAAKTAESNEIGSEFTPEGALAKAQELQRTKLSRQDGQSSHEPMLRRDAVIAVAAALIVSRFEWPKQNGHLRWCRDVLTQASNLKSGLRKSDEDDWESLPGISTETAIYGLVALVKYGGGDTKVKEQLLWMALSDSEWNVKAVFKSLQSLWSVEPVLCWNILNLRLEESLLRWGKRSEERAAERSKRRKQRVRAALNRIKKHEVPVLTQVPISEDVIFLSDTMAEVVPYLPSSVLLQNETDKERLLLFFDDLMRWTIAANSITRERKRRRDLPTVHKPYEWNPAFFDWTVRLSFELGEPLTQEHILKPVRESWLYAPQLTADLLHGYIQMWMEDETNLTPDSLKQWEQISSWVFDGYKEARSNMSIEPDQVKDAAAMLVFGSKFMLQSRLPDDWPHLTKFQAVIDRWVRVIGPDTDGMHSLLVLLKGAGHCFWPTPALEWMWYCVQNQQSNSASWWERSRIGERSSQLLTEMWLKNEQQIRSSPPIMHQFALLTDYL